MRRRQPICQIAYFKNLATCSAHTENFKASINLYQIMPLFFSILLNHIITQIFLT